MRVYHLSDAQHALNNIALWRIKISRFSDLNDPFELLGINLMDQNLREAFRSTKERLDKNNGLLCFSQSWGNPVLWSHYADKHRGICLGFDIPDKLLTKVNYNKKLLSITDKKTGNLLNAKLIMSELLRSKFIDWKYEDETRFFVKLDHKTAEAGLYFMPFSKILRLKEIILGPLCELSMENIRNLASIYPHKIDVIKARIAYSTYKVIRDTTATQRR